VSEGYSYTRHIEEDVRLIILRELHRQPAGRLNDTILTRVVEDLGHTKSRDWIRTQLRKLEELGAIALISAGTVLIATITRAGVEHVERRSSIEGVARPSLGA
jgi:hypothetical protein